MTEIPAAYFDGRTSQSRPVRLRWHALDGVLEVLGDAETVRYPPREFTIESRLGRTPRFIRFADGSRCEVADSPELDAVIASWLPRERNWLHRLETSWSLVLLAVLVFSAGAWATIRYGLPWGARKIAFALPADIMKQLGDQTLATLDRSMFRPTKLTHERQLALRAEFAGFFAAVDDPTTYQIEFRSSPEVGPNALALPSGVIVITDELVFLAKDDRELVGVLAHECGHILHRHALRGVLQNSAVFVVISLVTGDVSSATAFGAALPTYLLQSRFSREFEREADAHAIEMMHKAKLPPEHLAAILRRLAEEHGEGDSQLLAYLRTHPPTPERIEAIEQRSARP